jgi:hypothetical protein
MSSIMKVSDKPFATGGYGGKINVAELGSRIRAEVQKLLGDSITVDKHQNADLDAWKRYTHAFPSGAQRRQCFSRPLARPNIQS